jgi:hypothetical protein
MQNSSVNQVNIKPNEGSEGETKLNKFSSQLTEPKSRGAAQAMCKL